MINKIKKLIKSEQFKVWLSNPQLWESLNIDYHPPRVERVWMPFNDMRVSLHVIHPSGKYDTQIHSYPWELASYVLPIGGKYEQGIGYRGFDKLGLENKIVCTQELGGDMYYEILDPNALHYVRPYVLPVFMVTITGPKIWGNNGVILDKKLEPLSEERKKEILQTFKHYFE